MSTAVGDAIVLPKPNLLYSYMACWLTSYQDLFPDQSSANTLSLIYKQFEVDGLVFLEVGQHDYAKYSDVDYQILGIPHPRYGTCVLSLALQTPPTLRERESGDLPIPNWF